jgi:feruloyl esterase
MTRSTITFGILAIAALSSLPASASPCESLAALALKDATITSANVVRTGQFSPPDRRETAGAPDLYRQLPEFCRVTATLTPSSDSDIRMEVWLPAAGWNGKFQAVGNGG